MNYDSPRFSLNVGQSKKASKFKVDLLAVQNEQEMLKKELEKRSRSRFARIWGAVNECDYRTKLQPIQKSTAELIKKTRIKVSDDNESLGDRYIDLPGLDPQLKSKIERLSFFWFFKVIGVGTRKLFKYLNIASYFLGKWFVLVLRFFYFGGIGVFSRLLCKVKKSRTKLIVESNPIEPIIKAINKPKSKSTSVNYWTGLENEVPSKTLPASAYIGIVRSIDSEDEYYPYPKLLKMKRALSFALILLFLVLPLKSFSIYSKFDLSDLKGRVLGAADAAIGDFKMAAGSAGQEDFDIAADYFTQAGTNFLKAEAEVADINSILLKLAGLMPNDEFKLASNAKHIISAGEAVANLGAAMSRTLSALQNHSRYTNISEVINEIIRNLNDAEKYAQVLKSEFASIDAKNIPEDMRESFELVRDKSALLSGSLSEFKELLTYVQIFLGSETDKRYLVVFQNNTEMRASGGFIGSYALVDFSRGRIKNLEAPGGGSYDTEAGLYERIVAPEALWIVNPLWHFWDANWWPDWEMSAMKLKWFYEKSQGPTVDGVIGMTPTVVERLLSVIGPVDMTENYNVVINAENFWDTVQSFSEQKSDITNKPKMIIGDLMQKIIEELPKRLNKDTMLGIVNTLESLIQEKHIMVYMTDADLQSKVEEFGWDAKLKNTAWDYLSVVHTNIAGGKSDRKINEQIKHSVAVMEDGSIIDTVIVVRQHTGAKNETFSGVRNNDWMRIYVPLGSELLAASGFSKPDESYFEKPDSEWSIDPDVAATEGLGEIHKPSGTLVYNELGKTVFANWQELDPGQSATVMVKYKLPFKLEFKELDTWLKKLQAKLNLGEEKLIPYALMVQKQPGSQGVQISSHLELNENMKVAWRYPAGINTDPSGWEIKDTLSVDKYWAVILSE